jgi:Smg8_Smg9
VHFQVILNACRQKIQPVLTDLLKRLVRSNNNVGISKDWISAGRPCSPRMLFVFEGCPVGDADEDGASAGRSRSQVNEGCNGIRACAIV